MTSSGLPDLASDTPIFPEIRKRGVFDETSCDLLEGITPEVVRDEAKPATVTHAVVQNRAALAGVLDALLRIRGTTLYATASEST